MKIYLSLLGLIPTCVLASSLISIGQTEDATFYIEPTSLQRNGDLVSFIGIRDFAKTLNVNGKNVASSKSKEVINCSKRLSRLMGYSLYSGKTGTGALVAEEAPNNPFQSISPGTADDAKMKYVCSR